MTKKVLVLSASFRKHGNSDMLCDRFIQGAREAGNEVEKIYVSDMRIGYCRAAASATGRTNACKTTIWPPYWTRWLRLMLSSWQRRFIFIR